MRRALLMSMLVFAACKTPAPTVSAVRTDETQGVLRRFCDRYEAEGNLPELRDAACECLKSRFGDGPVAKAACTEGGGLDQWDAFIRSTLKVAGRSSITNTAGDAPGPDDLACLNQLVDFQMEVRTSNLEQLCGDKSVDDRVIRDLTTFPARPPVNQCWRLTHMDADACMIAEPCDPSQPADLAGLPLEAAAVSAHRATHGVTLVPAGQAVTICNARIQAIHRLKDPGDVERPYNLAFANFLAWGQSAPNVSFHASNCHGTAQAVAGGFLDAMPVSAMTYNGPYVEADCKQYVEPLMRSVEQKVKAAGRSSLASDFPIAEDGHVINMNHDPSCEAGEVGEPKFYVSGCKGGRVTGHIQYYDMCINTWADLLAKTGRTALPPGAGWQDLKAGCVMTANDHSISLVMKNDLWCYYYEATSPYGPPLLRVDTCPLLFAKFERRYCPAAPLAFTLKSVDD